MSNIRQKLETIITDDIGALLDKKRLYIVFIKVFKLFVNLEELIKNEVSISIQTFQRIKS